jgi:LAO/AO transport system kinase
VTGDPERHAEKLLRRARRGDVPSIGQLITALESNSPVGRAARSGAYAAAGHAHVVGVTGAPGSGKSTLVSALSRELRARGRTVGIIAVDPSSSLTGGAILGDRIRMQGHTLDPGTFMRSMSSRGRLGGVSRAAVDAVTVLDACGRDVIVVETVGAGQTDVEIVQIAHTTLVVSVPGLGDDIQAIKAGLLELADIHVVNKCDRPGADKTVAELLQMLSLKGPPADGTWAVPVLAASAANGTGVAELADAVDQHAAWLRESGELARRERAATVARIRNVAKDLLLERMQDANDANGFSSAVDEVMSKRLDPHAAAIRLIGPPAGAAEPPNGRAKSPTKGTRDP